MVIGGHRVQANEKFWTNIQELSGTVHLYGLLTTLPETHNCYYNISRSFDIVLRR